eukprot:TRINITY_DN2814_c0_g2_i2.p1 TRINITY_DN2814_c0_g2~~TRINITY_DN2814_c0_g2_i2.p1  ORF type:complete len:882 (+),score=222.79 TRINITY_DN2814_c0_g2_i2:1433-4078(+)
MQESKSASIMDGFASMTPQMCLVLRDGADLSEIPAADLVVGDIVYVRPGDKVPADIRILASQNFRVDNSSLTGEAEPQSRAPECTDENPLETHNLAFYSSLATDGSAHGVVILTGDRTVIGLIAGMTSSAKTELTPLQKEIDRFIKIISAVAIALGIIFLVVGFAVKVHWIANVVFAIGIIVANVPEGLLPTVTVALSVTAKALARKNVLVKNLASVETLGSCSTICSDKTGTLTQNKMTVAHLVYDGRIWNNDNVELSAGHFQKDAPSFKMLHNIATLCNRAVFNAGSTSPTSEGGEHEGQSTLSSSSTPARIVGDASESALLRFFHEVRNSSEHRMSFPKLYEVPFNSTNKWQLSIHHDLDTDLCILMMKGAPERIMSRCDRVLVDGAERDFDERIKAEYEACYEAVAGNGERALGFAYTILSPDVFTPAFEYDMDLANFPVTNLVFTGLVSLIDPPRHGVADSVAQCRDAGIRVIMVTGDHPLTAKAIAKQVGIIQDETVEDIAAREGVPVNTIDPATARAVVIPGSAIDSMSSEEWDAVLAKRQIVFARTSPDQKLLIVENCQKRGEIVAVTGDGVNDSPALKKADLGCAMGISGSDVSRDAADVILLDDNFSSIVTGIRQGRIIFDNLKKSICYTLSSNSAELAPFIAFMVLQMPLALSAVLILCIDLGTDMVPAISFAYEAPESNIMRRPPRNPKVDRLVTVRLAVFSYLWLGTVQAVAGFLNYYLVLGSYGIHPADILFKSLEFFRTDTVDPFLGYSPEQQLFIVRQAQTTFFVGVVLTRIGVCLTCKTRRLSLFQSTQSGKHNVVMYIAILIELAIVLVLVNVPGVQNVFGTVRLDWHYWFVPLPFFVVLIGFDELRKLAMRRSAWAAHHLYY